MGPGRREVAGPEVQRSLCVRAREEPPTCPVHKKEVGVLGVGGVYHPDSLPGAHRAETAASAASLDRPVGGGVRSPSTSARCGPHLPTFHHPVPRAADGSQPFLQQEGQELEKNFPTVAGRRSPVSIF